MSHTGIPAPLRCRFSEWLGGSRQDLRRVKAASVSPFKPVNFQATHTALPVQNDPGMKACLLRSPARIETNPLEFVDVPTPRPAPGEVLVRVTAWGVCRTDLHAVEREPKRACLSHAPGPANTSVLAR